MKFNIEQKVTGYNTQQSGAIITVRPEEINTIVHYEVTPEDMVEFLKHFQKCLFNKDD